ncbi:MAG: HEAT repeat domain-containing protein [Acidobacteria bacterium]|nr:HEAT repeat domain-containing protein [Acidobacteriota bacterium]
MNRLRAFLNLERGEETPVFLLFSYLTLILTCYMITKAARDGIFLYKFSPMLLPYVYIGIAVLIGFVVVVYLRLAARVDQAWLISGSLLFFITNILLLWWAVRLDWKPAPWIFYVWTSIFGIVVTTQVWTVANNVLDLRQAKRIFALVSSGGILGGAVGGLIAARLVKSIGTDNLLLTLVPILLLVISLVQFLIRRYSISEATNRGASGAGEGPDFRGAARLILGARFLKLIVGLLALSAIVTLIVDFQFKIVAKEAIQGKDQLTAFFASFSSYMAGGAFLLQVLAGSRIVERVGVRVTLFILPIALMFGTVTLIAFPLALWAGGVLKGSDYALRYSIDRATTELLYVPVSQSVKTQIKAIIDMIVQRLADGLGGFLLLGLVWVLPKARVQEGVGVFNLCLLAVWLWVAWQVRKEYVATIRARITDRPDLPKSTIRTVFDNQLSVATLKSMLASPDDEVVLYAMETAVALGRQNWIPHQLTAHHSARVRLKATELALLTEEELLDRAKVDSNSTVRASAVLRASKLAVSGRAPRGLDYFLQSPDVRVRLAALVALSREGNGQGKCRVRQLLDGLFSELEPNSFEWKTVAETLGEISNPEAAEFHLRLFHHENPAVRRAAILSAGKAGHRELVPFLIPLLADPRFAADVRVGLRDYGPRILGTLSDMFKDPTVDIEIRRNIPLVLAYIAHQESVEILLDGLFDYDALLRYRAIRALAKLRLLDADLRFDVVKVTLRIREESEMTTWHRQVLSALYPQDGTGDLLSQLLKEKIERGKDRVLRLLALLLPPNAAVASLLAMTEDDRLRRAAVAEFLDNVLPGKLRDYVLPVIEPKSQSSKSKQSVSEILEACLRNPDPILRECTADAIARGRWPEYSCPAPAASSRKV